MYSNETVEHVIKSNYLGARITSNRKLIEEVIIEEVRSNSIKASQISGSLKDIVWNNKYMSTENKVKIYETYSNKS